MIVTFRKVHEGAVLPERGTRYSVGYDLACCEDTIVPWDSHALVRTGLALANIYPMEDRLENSGRTLHELQIRPRSSLFPKWNLIIPNSPGTIDPDYRGELLISVLYVDTPDPSGSRPFRIGSGLWIPAGTKLAQLVVASAFVPTMRLALEDDLVVETERGAGGFGSTTDD